MKARQNIKKRIAQLESRIAYTPNVKTEKHNAMVGELRALEARLQR